MKPKQFEAFYQTCDLDTVHEPVLAVVSTMCFNDQDDPYKLVFVTGRPERTRDKTVEWLEQKCRIHEDHYILFMRHDDDTRPDYVVKQEILDKYIDKNRVLFVLDDRQQVVDMWRRNGLTCMQVAAGNF
jgi:hypothetical protein